MGEHDRHEGDRWRLFRAVADFVAPRTVFYPGSYIDIAPSFVFDSVTYLDTDERIPNGHPLGAEEAAPHHH